MIQISKGEKCELYVLIWKAVLHSWFKKKNKNLNQEQCRWLTLLWNAASELFNFYYTTVFLTCMCFITWNHVLYYFKCSG